MDKYLNMQIILCLLVSITQLGRKQNILEINTDNIIKNFDMFFLHIQLAQCKSHRIIPHPTITLSGHYLAIVSKVLIIS